MEVGACHPEEASQACEANILNHVLTVAHFNKVVVSQRFISHFAISSPLTRHSPCHLRGS